MEIVGAIIRILIERIAPFLNAKNCYKFIKAYNEKKIKKKQIENCK